MRRSSRPGRKSRFQRKKGTGAPRARRAIESLEPRTVLSTGYLQLSVASDQPALGLIQDKNLVAPWGVAVNSTGGDLWLSDHGSGAASLYLGGVAGSPLGLDSLSVAVPGGSPTGAAANSSTSFPVQSGASSGPASYLFESDGGQISGWNSNVPPPSPSTSAQTAVTTSGAVYMGLALANSGGQDLLYAADFHNNRIDVFNATFTKITLAGTFTDPNLPAGYAPFNIANVGGRLLVSYAVQDGAKQNDSPGVGHGVIDTFNYNGQFTGRLITGGQLNSPWGMALAPASFGDFSGQLLIANAGDGKINAFDPTTGAFQGTLSSPSGNPLVINGVHGLSFGNGLTAGDTNALFVTAVGNGGQHGLLSEIVSAQSNPFPAQGNVVAPVAHVNFSGVVAVFNDARATPASGFTATINWGDGFINNGTVTALASGGFVVTGSHSYDQSGQKTVTVQLRDSANNVTTAKTTANVAPPGLVFTAPTVTATEGMSFSGPVASFIDQDGNGEASFYTTTIDWGDGTTTAGTLSEGMFAPFTLTGNHTYATTGTEPMTVTVNDFDGATGTEQVNATVVSSLSGASRTFSTTETSLFAGTVASFNDANTSRNLSDYSANIDWGDGTTSPGSILPDAGGGFDVTGDHTYAGPGTQTVRVAISDPGSTITVLSTAEVADIDTLTGSASSVAAAQGSQFSGQVGMFTDTRILASPSDFAATIAWGDGSTSTGTVTDDSGVFTVSGTHTYAEYGPFNFSATVHHINGTATVVLNGTATVADSDVFNMSATTIHAAAGSAYFGAVATVSDTYTGSVASDFNASINWGDGATTTGTVTGANGQFTIAGSHAYSNEGTFAPVVTIADRAPGTATASVTSTAEITPAPPSVTAVTINGPEQSPLAVEVATFTQAGATTTAGDYIATIAWGDGATSTGTVTANASSFNVSGSHVYADEGHYKVTVSVSVTGGASASAAGTADIVEAKLVAGAANTPDTRWINEIYSDLLGRPADLGALNFWSSQLAAGVSRQQVVATIEASGEYRGDEVRHVFQTFLKRPAESDAVAFGTGYLATHTLEQFMAWVAGSGEYFQAQGSGTNDGFLDALFRDALDRSVDSGARAFFDQLLASGTSTAQVASMVFASGEYLNDVVASTYLSTLDRAVDSGGQGYFAGLLKQGSTDEQITAMLAASDEYFAKTSE